MTTLVEILEQLIDDNWKIERKDANWIIREKNQTENPELMITGVKMLGFSLDREGKDPWPFMKALKGMRSVCDGIIIATIEETSYVIAVELKSGNLGKASKQIESAWHLMEWLRSLLALNGHWSDGWEFCGLLSATPRKQENKGTTRRSSSMAIHSTARYRTAHIRNQRRINLFDFHREMKAHG